MNVNNDGVIWASYLVIHLIGLVGYTLLVRVSATGKINNIFLTSIMQTALFVPGVAFLLLGNVHFDLTAHQWAFLVLVGFTLAGVTLTNVWALGKLEASEFSVIYNLRLVVTTVLAYFFLDELPTPLQVIGGGLILASIYVLNLHRGGRWKSGPVLAGLFTMFWFSVHAVIEKYNLRSVEVQTYLFFLTAIGMILLWALVAIMRIPVREQLPYLRNRSIPLMLVLRVLSGYFYVFALPYGTLAITGYVSGMSVVLIVLFGMIVLGETDHMRRKLGASALAAAGLTSIMRGKLL